MGIKIAGIGELLWDILPEGKHLGGAPCNFAFHMRQAGFDTFVISAVGKDKDGEEIMEVLDQLQLKDSFVRNTRDYPTGTVTVKLNPNGIPGYTIHENVAWDHIEWTDGLDALAGEVDAVCFGSLAQRDPVSGNTICRFLEATKPECLRVFDINLRLIAYTMGSSGSLLLTHDERSFCKVPEIEVADTVGAGDSFTAILLAGMLNNLGLKTTHIAATEIAAFVCTQSGATPKLPRKLLSKIII